MDPYLLVTFQRHLLHQLECVVRAANDVNAALKTKRSEVIFYPIQNLLTAAANAGKVLWGQKGKLATERKPLRDSVGVLDTSPLRDVDMRNNYEHFDERIDRWWKESPGHSTVDLMVGPIRSIHAPGLSQKDWFRVYDPQTSLIYFWGEEFDLQAIVTEAERLIPLLQQAVAGDRILAAMQAHQAMASGKTGP